MISVIVVYNDVRILNEWLLESLKNQSADYELIALDNRKGDFPSATNAYNYGGLRARGDYLMFVHQDVRLLGNTWIEEAERILRNLPKLGAAGVAGKRCDIRGVITNAIHGVPPRPAGQIRISKPVKVQTLDPLLIIVPRKVFQRLKYDEHTCNGWHLYSEDYCLTLQREGFNCYVLPLPVYHRSTGVKPKKRKLIDYGPYPDEYYAILKKVLRKHRLHYRKICTTCGDYYTFIPLFIQLTLPRVMKTIFLRLFGSSLRLLIRSWLLRNFVTAYFTAKYRRLLREGVSLDDLIDFAFEFVGLPLVKSHQLSDIDLINALTIRPAQVKEEIREFLSILQKIRPKIILEIGTERGGTLFLLSQVADEDATLISIDLPWDNRASKGHSFGFSYPPWREKLYRSFARGNQKIYLLRGDSHSQATLMEVKRILRGRKLDVLFIDGDHTYEGVKKDFEMYSPLVRKGGIIAFHDIVPDYYTRYGIRTKSQTGGVPFFWQEIKTRYKHLEIIKDPSQDGYGIGVIYV